MTTTDCTLEKSLQVATDGDIYRRNDINQNDVACMEEESCGDADGVSEGCQDALEMDEEVIEEWVFYTLLQR